MINDSKKSIALVKIKIFSQQTIELTKFKILSRTIMMIVIKLMKHLMAIK